MGLGIKGILGKVASSAAGDVVTSVANAVDQFITTPDEKAAAKVEIEKEVNRHMEALADSANKELELELADMNSARSMQIEALKQDDKFSKRFTYYLAMMVIIFVFIFDTAMFFVKYPQENRDMINQVAGILNATALVMVLSFFFGSSMGSKKAGETIERMANK